LLALPQSPSPLAIWSPPRKYGGRLVSFQYYINIILERSFNETCNISNNVDFAIELSRAFIRVKNLMKSGSYCHSIKILFTNEFIGTSYLKKVVNLLHFKM
jgi:hypothetical protein